jgi:hypothetical protein
MCKNIHNFHWIPSLISKPPSNGVFQTKCNVPKHKVVTNSSICKVVENGDKVSYNYHHQP